MADTTPDPHRDEPTPAPQEGMRPEAVASGVRPAQDEPNGPLPGLLATAAAEITGEVTDSPEAQEQLEAAGVEDEGLETGQIMGITVAILASVAILSIAVFWVFYLPKLNATQDQAGSSVELSAEGRSLNAEAEARMENYGLMADSTFTLPISAAMESIVEDYSGSAANAALEGQALADGEPMSATRQGFNTAPVQIAPMGAVRAAASPGGSATPTPEAVMIDVAPEEVGVDGDAELTLPRTDSDE